MTTSPFCLVIDASCDIPPALLDHAQLRVLPVHVHVGGKQLIDRRKASDTQRFYREALSLPTAIKGYSEPLKIEEMVAAFNSELALKFDEMLGVFVASSRSAIFDRAKSAVSRARIASYPLRVKAGKLTPLQVDCVDSQALFAGYGAQIMDLLDLVNQGAGISAIIERQRTTVTQTYAYMVPGNVSYILERASLKGEKSVSALAGFAAKTLSITPIIRAHLGQTEPVGRKLGKAKARLALVEMAQRMLDQDVLLSRHVCFAYSGDLQEIATLPSYIALCSSAEQRQVQVHLTDMSMTGSVNVGPGSLVLGVLAKPHKPDALL
jgi:DegV family protein with EDD domain